MTANSFPVVVSAALIVASNFRSLTFSRISCALIVGDTRSTSPIKIKAILSRKMRTFFVTTRTRVYLRQPCQCIRLCTRRDYRSNPRVEILAPRSKTSLLSSSSPTLHINFLFQSFIFIKIGSIKIKSVKLTPFKEETGLDTSIFKIIIKVAFENFGWFTCHFICA